jgi:LuxR family transcriptional regulator, quorum-sensing system regulator SdiA
VTNQNIVTSVAAHLQDLRAMCDSGYALAIHIRYTRPSLLYRSYHQAWIDHYSERGFMLTDPVVHWGLTHIGSINWADLSKEDTEGVLRDALAHGLHNGWTYATGPATARTIAGLTKTGADFTAAERAEIARIVDALHALTEGLDAMPAEDQAALRALN